MQAEAHMNQIRISWRVQGQPPSSGHWHPDSPGNRKMLEVILASNVEIHGAGTHWIETRVVGGAELDSFESFESFEFNLINSP